MEQSKRKVQGQMIPVTIQKLENKHQSRPEVFLLYQIPIIVTNEDLKNISAEIFLVPYSQLMIQ